MKRRTFLRNIVLFIFAFLFGYIFKKEDENTILQLIDSNRVRGKDAKLIAEEFKVLTEQSVDTAINVKTFGAKGDGIADDTLAIQDAINSLPNGGKILIPDGTYIINADTSLKPNSNQTLSLSKKAKLKAKSNSDASYQIINIVEKVNVIIEGGFIEGERDEHVGVNGEAGMGISIVRNSKNITIRNTHISKCWADGIYIGGSLPCYNINIYNVTCDNNRRQGMSVVNVDTLTVRDSFFTNTAGTLPEAGIDIEPEKYSTVKNVTIDNVVCTGNRSGLDVFGWANTISNIQVLNSCMINNREYGLSIAFTTDIIVLDSLFSNNGKNGINMARDNVNVFFSNCQVLKSNYSGVKLETSLQRNKTQNIGFTSCIFKNNGQDSPNLYDGVTVDTEDLKGKIDGVTFIQCSFIDNQVIKTQRYGLNVGNNTRVMNVLIGYGNKFRGNATSAKNVSLINTLEME
ncbi:glycosyl hydrolase family 28-related protein [Peribacillus simplex]|uniref:glycosyl hydrolase family 28-related protein n=1 Tax=Peribacillus simplex TaxID=1478 RepID=UPI0007770196|nr:glycosyl hydrolase family 28-related protein [Peribacillus simplex]